jgi:hypothetical protein
MTIITTRQQRRELERENARRPLYLEGISREDWPNGLADRPGAPFAVWRSRHFLVQFYKEPAPGVIGRLSILRTTVAGDRWADGITWDDIQRLKAETGHADTWAVEVFPADAEVVNVANIRHVWLLAEAPAYAWRKQT